MRHQRSRHSDRIHGSAPILLALAVLIAVATPATGQEAFACDGGLVIQGDNAQLWAQLKTWPPAPDQWQAVGSPHAEEINCMGYRPTDGLLYAFELTPNGNSGLVTIDKTGLVTPFGYLGLPVDERFDACDISADGDTMYVNRAGLSPLYKIDLNLLTVAQVPIAGATGHVHVWAYNPADGLLYGGDTAGQLAVLDPDAGIRVDHAVGGVVELPRGVAYGGAWMDLSGLLSLYRNDGSIYVIDLAGPTVVAVKQGAAADHNDAASCMLGGMEFWDPSLNWEATVMYENRTWGYTPAECAWLLQACTALAAKPVELPNHVFVPSVRWEWHSIYFDRCACVQLMYEFLYWP